MPQTGHVEPSTTTPSKSMQSVKNKNNIIDMLMKKKVRQFNWYSLGVFAKQNRILQIRMIRNKMKFFSKCFKILPTPGTVYFTNSGFVILICMFPSASNNLPHLAHFVSPKPD